MPKQPKKLKLDPGAINAHKESLGDVHLDQVDSALAAEHYGCYFMSTLSKSGRVSRNVFEV